MAPFLPESTREALSRLGADPDNIDAKSLRWGWLETGRPVRVADPIFPRIDVAQYIGGSKPVEEQQQPKPEQQPASPAAATPAPAEAATSPAQSGAPTETTQAAAPGAAKITIDQFMATELRVAEIRTAERVPKSKKLIQMSVFTGDDERTIVAGIGTRYAPEELVGRKVVIVANLQPAKLMGIESNGMVLAASMDGEPSLLSVDPGVPAGTRVR